VRDVALVGSLGRRIVLLYAGAEVASALLLVASPAAFGASLRAVAAAIFCAALAAVTVTDIERRIVPNRVVLPATVAVLALQTAARPSPEWAVAAVAASGFLLLAALAYPAGMGLGDVKLALLIGAALGRGVAVALVLGMLAASSRRRSSSPATAHRRGRWRSRSRPSSRSAPSSPFSPAGSRTSEIAEEGFSFGGSRPMQWS
jgi:Type IV leader peptidase family